MTPLRQGHRASLTSTERSRGSTSSRAGFNRVRRSSVRWADAMRRWISFSPTRNTHTAILLTRWNGRTCIAGGCVGGIRHILSTSPLMNGRPFNDSLASEPPKSGPSAVSRVFSAQFWARYSWSRRPLCCVRSFYRSSGLLTGSVAPPLERHDSVESRRRMWQAIFLSEKVQPRIAASQGASER